MKFSIASADLNQLKAREFMTIGISVVKPRKGQIMAKTSDKIVPKTDPEKLRDLANFYREFAQHTTIPAIWDARLRTAEDLEREAAKVDAARARAAGRGTQKPPTAEC
jgi:hypothetical protein